MEYLDIVDECIIGVRNKSFKNCILDEELEMVRNTAENR